jgi:hypothetical protein
VKTYTIKPLKWEKSFTEDCQRYRAEVPMGSYTVSRNKWASEDDKWSHWQFEYCFDEYYDESYRDCDNAKHGKQLAEEDWLRRILPALEEAS